MSFEVGDRVRIRPEKFKDGQKLFGKLLVDVPMTIVGRLGVEDIPGSFIYSVESEPCPCCGYRQEMKNFGGIWFEKVEGE